MKAGPKPRVVHPEVGTSRSALLLTVRVESGIARTKSNNGPRGWLSSLLFLFFIGLREHTDNIEGCSHTS